MIIQGKMFLRLLGWFLIWVLIVGGTEALRCFSQTKYRRSQFNPSFSTSLSHADLTPAVDKYPLVPKDSFDKGLLKWKRDTIDHATNIDPFSLVADDLLSLTEQIELLLKSESLLVTQAASHFFKHRQGKRVRPTIVALLGRAVTRSPMDYPSSYEREKHLKLGQLIEMIHVASLMHDDVIDESSERRGGSALHRLYSNKVAILAGDFLLARASIQLARLQHSQVVELVSSALDSLVQGEIMQARCSENDLLDINHYVRKSFMKTGSLICSSCKSVSLLSGFDEQSATAKMCEQFGNHLGLAFQIFDDILDYTGSSAELGKPTQADMKLGLATAPILFASQEVPELRDIIKRRFKFADDIEKALKLSAKTNCIDRSYHLANFHANLAIDALQPLPPSEYKKALINLVEIVISRKS